MQSSSTVSCYFIFFISLKVTPVGNSAINAAGRNAVVTSLMIGCAFIVCWTPFVVMTFAHLVGLGRYLRGAVMFNFSMVLALTNSCINPFVYAAKYREFQDGVRRLVAKVKPKQQQSQVSAIRVAVNTFPSELVGTR